MKSYIAIISLSLILFIFFCAEKRKFHSPGGPSVINKTTKADGVTKNTAGQNQPQTQDFLTANRKIIRNASISLYVEDLNRDIRQIHEITESYKGIILNKAVNQHLKKSVTCNLTIWVKPEQLVDFVDRIHKVGRLISSNINSQDITEAYFDLEARMSTLKKQETRLLALLEKENTKLKELLELERELARVREVIESLEGKKRVWDKQVAFSTVTIYLTQDVDAIKGPDSVWKPFLTAIKKIKDTFLYSFGLLMELLGFLITACIFLIPWFLGLLLLVIVVKYSWKGLKSLLKRLFKR